MYAGQLVFAQLMEHLPWQTFRRIVERYGGDHRVRDFSCANQFRCMAFAQLTYRDSLRDIVTCLRAQSAKLYHLGIRGAVAKSTLADANEARDWRIYAEVAQHLIRIARRLYVDEPFGVDLKNTVYALDATTIDLCLALFPWAPFRSTKAAIKLHTLIDLRGNIPSFIHISDGKLHDVNVLDQLLPEPGAFYVMDRGYLDFERLHRLHLAGAFFVTRAKSNLKAKRRYSRAVDRSTGLICDQTITLTVFYSKVGYPEPLRRIRFKTDKGKTLVFLTNNFELPALTITELYRSRWQVVVLWPASGWGRLMFGRAVTLDVIPRTAKVTRSVMNLAFTARATAERWYLSPLKQWYKAGHIAWPEQWHDGCSIVRRGGICCRVNRP